MFLNYLNPPLTSRPSAGTSSQGGELYYTPCSLHPAEPCSMFPAPCSLHPAPCSMFPAPCSLLPAPCSLLPAPCSLLPAPCSLLPAPCSLLHVPCSLLPAPCSLPQCLYTFMPLRLCAFISINTPFKIGFKCLTFCVNSTYFCC
jgi:hypothetical protein